MSITISPAFRLSKDADVFSVAEQLRSVITPMLVKEFRKQITNYIAREFDTENPDNLCFRDYFKSTLSRVSRSFVNEAKDSDTFLTLITDGFRHYKAVFVRNSVRDETYLLFSQFNLGEGFEETVLSIDGIEDEFSYWDGSDSQLEYLTEKEWRDRKVAWEESISIYGNVFEQGLVIQFFGPMSATFKLASFNDYVDSIDELVTDRMRLQRERNVLFNKYASLVLEQESDLEMLDFIRDAYPFLLAHEGIDYSALPLVEDYPECLDEARTFAQVKIASFPLTF